MKEENNSANTCENTMNFEQKDVERGWAHFGLLIVGLGCCFSPHKSKPLVHPLFPETSTLLTILMPPPVTGSPACVIVKVRETFFHPTDKSTIQFRWAGEMGIVKLVMVILEEIKVSAKKISSQLGSWLGGMMTWSCGWKKTN